MVAYKIYENNIIFSISENVMRNCLKKVNFYLFHENLRFPVSSICIHIKISCACHVPSISNLFPNTEQRLLFKMVPNMFVNRY